METRADNLDVMFDISCGMRGTCGADRSAGASERRRDKP